MEIKTEKDPAKLASRGGDENSGDKNKKTEFSELNGPKVDRAAEIQKMQAEKRSVVKDELGKRPLDQ